MGVKISSDSLISNLQGDSWKRIEKRSRSLLVSYFNASLTSPFLCLTFMKCTVIFLRRLRWVGFITRLPALHAYDIQFLLFTIKLR